VLGGTARLHRKLILIVQVGSLRQIGNPMPLVFPDTVIPHLLWGGQSWPQAGLPAGWTRWKASPQAEKPAPQN
jgi:hypothetical protein